MSRNLHNKVFLSSPSSCCDLIGNAASALFGRRVSRVPILCQSFDLTQVCLTPTTFPPDSVFNSSDVTFPASDVTLLRQPTCRPCSVYFCGRSPPRYKSTNAMAASDVTHIDYKMASRFRLMTSDVTQSSQNGRSTRGCYELRCRLPTTASYCVTEV